METFEELSNFEKLKEQFLIDCSLLQELILSTNIVSEGNLHFKGNDFTYFFEQKEGNNKLYIECDKFKVKLYKKFYKYKISLTAGKDKIKRNDNYQIYLSDEIRITIEEGTYIKILLKDKKIYIQNKEKDPNIKEFVLEGRIEGIIGQIFYDLIEEIHKNLNSVMLDKNKAKEIIQNSATEISKATEQ